MLIRRAVAADAEAITALVREAYAPYISRIGREPAPMLDDYPQVIARCTVFVVEVGGVVQGVLVLEPQDDCLLVQNVAVSAASRGLGLGKALMSVSERHALASGCTAIALYTNERMTENIGFYLVLGYQETHRAVDGGYARVFFRKVLES